MFDNSDVHEGIYTNWHNCLIVADLRKIKLMKKHVNSQFFKLFHKSIFLFTGPKNRLSQTVPAYGYWNVQFYQMEAAYVHFDLWLPRGSSLGFYARRNALPTHTNYDLMEVIKGANTAEQRTTRSVQVRPFKIVFR